MAKQFRSGEVRECLTVLKISVSELATFFSVSERTVARWLSDEVPTPGSAVCALKAWCVLEQLGIPWRPDGLPLVNPNLADFEIALTPNHSRNLVMKAIRAVHSRGGPSIPWSIDLEGRRATLADVWIKFRLVGQGGFVPQSYGRQDIEPDLERDRNLVEEGIACIAAEVGKKYDSIQKLRWTEVWV